MHRRGSSWRRLMLKRRPGKKANLTKWQRQVRVPCIVTQFASGTDTLLTLRRYSILHSSEVDQCATHRLERASTVL